MSRDFPLPISDEPAHAVDHWRVEQHPTTLIGFWPGKDPPTQVEVIKALEQHWNVEVLKQIDELEGAMWNGVYEVPILVQGPVIIWAEPAKPLPPGESNELHIAACKWVVGFEAMLNRETAVDEYTELLRAFASALHCQTVLDPITQRYWQSQALADLVCESPAELSHEDLWTIHAVCGKDQTKHDGDVWLHTHGLWRCGVPELEMLDVPHQYSGSAAGLLNDIAERSLFAGLPAPGEPFVIGHEFDVVLQPWQAMASNVASDNSGGMDDRAGESSDHAGVRAVICDPEPRGIFKKVWAWPEHAIKRYQRNDAVLYRTHAQSARQMRLAQQRWDDLAVAFASARHTPARFLVKARFETEQGDPEHLWLEIQRFEGTSAHAKVLSHPIYDLGIKHGEMCVLRRELVSDWGVHIDQHRFGPQNVPALWRRINQATTP